MSVVQEALVRQALRITLRLWSGSSSATISNGACNNDKNINQQRHDLTLVASYWRSSFALGDVEAAKFFLTTIKLWPYGRPTGPTGVSKLRSVGSLVVPFDSSVFEGVVPPEEIYKCYHLRLDTSRSASPKASTTPPFSPLCSLWHCADADLAEVLRTTMSAKDQMIFGAPQNPPFLSKAAGARSDKSATTSSSLAPSSLPSEAMQTSEGTKVMIKHRLLLALSRNCGFSRRNFWVLHQSVLRSHHHQHSSNRSLHTTFRDDFNLFIANLLFENHGAGMRHLVQSYSETMTALSLLRTCRRPAHTSELEWMLLTDHVDHVVLPSLLASSDMHSRDRSQSEQDTAADANVQSRHQQAVALLRFFSEIPLVLSRSLLLRHALALGRDPDTSDENRAFAFVLVSEVSTCGHVPVMSLHSSS